MNLLSLFVTYLTVPSEACVLKWSCRGSKEFLAISNQMSSFGPAFVSTLIELSLQMVHSWYYMRSD